MFETITFLVVQCKFYNAFLRPPQESGMGGLKRGMIFG